MYYIVEINGKVREIIDKSGRPNKYGKPKEFKTLENAFCWLSRKVGYHTTSQYEIYDSENDSDCILIYRVTGG